jgi:hypothetical protein
MLSSKRSPALSIPMPRLWSKDGSGRGSVLESADDRGENGAGNAAAGHLADNAADIRGRGAIGKQRDQHTEDLSPGAAADRACDGISQRAKIDILGRTGGDIAADRAAPT